jgi:hypothetical protein
MTANATPTADGRFCFELGVRSLATQRFAG